MSFSESTKANCFKTQTLSLDFNNKIDNDSLSVLSFHYLYNGGGVGIADFNNDGFKDIFMSGNLVSCKLFSGDGKLNFKDVSEEAGLKTRDWVNGVSVIDLNNDGLKDIYLSVGGPNCDDNNCSNLLFINESDSNQFAFVERSKEYGLDTKGYSQQALFFDADLDGDLDVYQLQNYVDPKSKNYPQPKRYFSKKSFDKFLINGYSEQGRPTFEDASKEWNVQLPGFGLGLALSDFNEDGYPDLYIANDFITDDIIYINQSGKGFINKAAELLKHTTYNSMGIDIGDINDDQLQDIVVVDMLPLDNERQKTMLGGMNYTKYQLSRSEGYNAQFIRNTVQINNGLLNKELTPFTDYSAALNLHQTDWSWSPLVADFDNDTDSDIFISNGYGKNITDLDFVNFNANQVGFGGKEAAMRKMKEQVNSLEAVNLSNHLFLKNDNGQFSDFHEFTPGISNGVAYGDLDNDGDLDLVLNNINDEATILVNDSQNNFIKVRLSGDHMNKDAIGAEVTITLTNGLTIKKTLAPTRSYLSTMDSELVFGMGQDSLQSLEVKWPDGKHTLITENLVNKTVELKYHDKNFARAKTAIQEPILSQQTILNQEESSFAKEHDFSLQPLLTKSCRNEKLLLSPALDSRSLMLANYNSSLSLLDLSSGSINEYFNLGGYVVTDLKEVNYQGANIILLCAYNSEIKKSELLALELKNKSAKILAKKELALGSYQFDVLDQSDSLIILAVQYPHPQYYPMSNGPAIQQFKLKANDLVSVEITEFPKDLNCLTDIEVVDLNKDGESEIVISGEWMPPFIASLKDGFLRNCPIENNADLKGLWQSVTAADLDNDGDLDLLLANIGKNIRHKFDSEQSLTLVSEDLDNNGSFDPLLSYYNSSDNKTYSYHSRDDIAKQLPSLKAHYPSYSSFASADFKDILSVFQKEVQTKTANRAESIVLENDGQNNFKIRALPNECQMSIVNSFVCLDANNDEFLDIIALTNHSTVETHNGNIDGLNGLLMLGKGNMVFESKYSSISGLNIPEDGQDAVLLENGKELLISSNKALYKISSN